MKNIIIGNKINASAISLGCMRMSGLDEKGVDSIMDTALELGINYFDHADIYGGGRSEELFGKVLKDNPTLRSEIILQSKCGIRQGRYDLLPSPSVLLSFSSTISSTFLITAFLYSSKYVLL